VPDLDGDGRQEILRQSQRFSDGNDEIALLSLASGQLETRWQHRLPEFEAYQLSQPDLGDVTGDGVGDLLVRHFSREPGASDRDFVILDGATGQEIPAVGDGTLGPALVVGDVDKVPGAELAVFRDGDQPEAQYLNSAAEIVARRPLPAVGSATSLADGHLLGDLDGDGVQEITFDLRRGEFLSDNQSLLVLPNRAQIVAGTVRPVPGTTTLTRSTPTGLALLDSTSLNTIWHVDRITDPDWADGPAVADVTGDGIPDMLVEDRGMRVLDGRTGDTVLYVANEPGQYLQVLDLRG
jgi:hypothetical protein